MFGWVSKFRKDEKGNVMLMFALGLPVVIGAAGFGVETTYW